MDLRRDRTPRGQDMYHMKEITVFYQRRIYIIEHLYSAMKEESRGRILFT